MRVKEVHFSGASNYSFKMFQKDQTTILRLEILAMVVRESPSKEILARLRREVRKIFKSRDRGWMDRKNSLPKSSRGQKL